MSLDAGRVIEARATEVKHVRDNKVWPTSTRREAQANGWKVITTRRIDISTGDDENPEYSSRLVGNEFNTGEMDGIFAGMPPLRRCDVYSTRRLPVARLKTHTHTRSAS